MRVVAQEKDIEKPNFFHLKKSKSLFMVDNLCIRILSFRILNFLVHSQNDSYLTFTYEFSSAICRRFVQRRGCGKK